MKCAFSDFDRTLYVDNQISERNVDAIKHWQALGNLFVLATGRNASSLRAILDTYDFHADAFILNNGAIILDKDWNELFCKTIDDTTAAEVLAFLHHLDNDGSGVSMRRGKVNILSHALTTTQKPCDGNITIENIDSLKDIVQIHRRKKDEEAISSLCALLNSRFPSISAYANVWNADIVAAGVDKSVAIDWLIRNLWDLDTRDIKVIGDSANDIRMIKIYHGATLKSANTSVQTEATYIVDDVAEYLWL